MPKRIYLTAVKIKIYKAVNFWLPVIVWMLFIFKLSGGSVPPASEDYWQDFAVKKVAHVLFFGFLAVLVYRALIAYKVPRKKAAIYSILFAVFYGATDEYHQTFTRGRQATLRDIGFDGLGASAFIYFIYSYISVLPKKVQDFLVKLGVS